MDVRAANLRGKEGGIACVAFHMMTLTGARAHA